MEVGSRNINGSARAGVEASGPEVYIGVDIAKGPGVDVICDITSLTKRFGHGTFDVVICTEVLEHIRDWRKAVNELKAVLRPDGVLFVTTRSAGFGFHGYPGDFWQYELADMEYIFGDLTIERLENDGVSTRLCS